MSEIAIDWQNSSSLSSKKYTCGYCGNPLASNKGYQGVYHIATTRGPQANYMHIYICHYCNKPTFFESSDKQHPGKSFGSVVMHIPDRGVENLYNEARHCIGCNAYTATVLCCRKLLMNITVSLGAAIGLSFKEYVDYLFVKGYIPPNAKEWVDNIREEGNEANHEIEFKSEEDAKKIIDFSEMLLKIVYEYPEKGRTKKA